MRAELDVRVKALNSLVQRTKKLLVHLDTQDVVMEVEII